MQPEIISISVNNLTSLIGPLTDVLYDVFDFLTISVSENPFLVSRSQRTLKSQFHKMNMTFLRQPFSGHAHVVLSLNLQNLHLPRPQEWAGALIYESGTYMWFKVG